MDSLRQMYLDHYAKEWDRAVSRIQRALQDETLKPLVKVLLTTDTLALTPAFGRAGIPDRYVVPYGQRVPKSLMDFTASFVEFEIKHIALGHYRRKKNLNYVRCDKDHPDAQPYICNGLKAPDCPKVTVQDVLDVIAWHIQERERVERAYHGQEYADRDYIVPERAAFVERLLNFEGAEP
jgi:hypothetical protein